MCLGKRRRRTMAELPREVQTAMYLAALDATPGDKIFSDHVSDNVFNAVHNEAWAAGIDAMAMLRERQARV